MKAALHMVVSGLRNRELIGEMTRREMVQGQSNTLLGQAWFFLNPVTTVLLYVFIFTVVFKLRLGEQAPAVGAAYLMAGIIGWLTTSDVMMRATGVIRANANLVKQIVFPVEVLVFKTVIAALMVQFVMLACVILFLLFSGVGLSWAQLLLAPGALVLQFVFLMGLALLLAAVSPFLPDVVELIGVISRIGLFVAPILYVPGMFGERYWKLFCANPFSYFVWTFQDAFAFQTVAHPVAWGVAAALAVFFFVLGATVFRNVSHGFGDVL